MLLTVSTDQAPASDLGFLLHKHPERPQTVDLSFGRAHVFYPEASDARCTVALLLEVDPVRLVRGRGPSGEGALDQYVNDRPWVASSFLSVALAQTFRSALAGTCKARPELVERRFPLEARLSVLPCRGGEGFLRRLFEPLGYTVTAKRHALAAGGPEWGESRYFSVSLSATTRLTDLLSHLYVLVPVLDDDKHYWVGDDEVEKLLRHGEGWLATHPERELIATRYLKHRRSLARAALERLVHDEAPAEEEESAARDRDEAALETKVSLDEQRRARVLSLLREAGVQRVAAFIDELVSHYVLDDGKLVVAHAGLKASMQGRGSGAVRSFALYGETTGETDEYGLPVRYPWADEYRGKAAVVYGHTPVPEAQWLNNTLCIDTGCVYGGKLTALRWPERQLVAVRASRAWCEPVRPLEAPVGLGRSAQQEHDDLLDLEDVLGKRVVDTRLFGKVTVREENAAAALEAMSRFAIDPRWLVYLPPTMSPSETSQREGYLEHPAEAFDYFRKQGVVTVVCEEKHMGSRAVLVVCRTADAARARFGVTTGEAGACFTRTGRRFFNDAALGGAFLERVRSAITAAGLWDELSTDWVCLDAELMPWSLKASALVREQYAAVGTAATAALSDVRAALAQAQARGVEVGALAAKAGAQSEAVARYVAAWQRYCWPVTSLEDVKLAPFHLLASEGAVHTDKDHRWHLELSARLAQQDSALMLATAARVVRLDDAAQVEDAARWWEALTGGGGEGMVVKPLDFIARGGRGLVQPAIKCRGRDYLRIIYGPDYAAPEHLERLRQRGVATKRSLALRELALGVEALERFVRREPLRRVHEAVFGVLALESEPVDPRL